MDLATRVHDAVSKVSPIRGVSIAAINDKSTWRVDFDESATADQRASALGVIAAFDANAVSSKHVNAERDRRLKSFPFNGKQYDFCDGKGSDINIAGAGTLALAAIMAGSQQGNLRWADPAVDFTWVTAGNETISMDAQTCLNFAKAAADWKAKHIRKARELKDASPIPADYASDNRWTS